MRFVFVRHPHRGELILMTTDLTLDPQGVIALYGYRFQIEVGFRQAVHVLGAYARIRSPDILRAYESAA